MMSARRFNHLAILILLVIALIQAGNQAWAYITADDMDSLAPHSWQAGGDTSNTVVEIFEGSVKWVFKATNASSLIEHILYSPTFGDGADWSAYDKLTFWMYAASPSGANSYAFFVEFQDDDGGWFSPLDGADLRSANYPMNQWVLVTLDTSGIAAGARDHMSGCRFTAIENIDPSGIQYGHLYNIYIDDVRLIEAPDPAVVDLMEDISTHVWTADGDAGGSYVEQNDEAAFVRQGSGSLQWTIFTDSRSSQQAEHRLISTTVGEGRSWAGYDTLEFMLYVTSPTGATSYAFSTKWLDDGGWLRPCSINGDEWIDSSRYPMNVWNRVVLDLKDNASARDSMTQTYWSAFENYQSGRQLEDGHIYLVYIDDVRLGHSWPASYVADVRRAPPGIFVRIPGLIVTREFTMDSEYFYAQQYDRSAGIRIRSRATVNPGDTISISGVVDTVSGEREIAATSVILDSAGTSPPPVGISGSSLMTAVPELAGLLVKAWGRITAAGSGWFTISDGATLIDPDGNKGVRVLLQPGGLATPPQVGDYLSVIGPVGIMESSGQFYPVVRLKSSADYARIAP